MDILDLSSSCHRHKRMVFISDFEVKSGFSGEAFHMLQKEVDKEMAMNIKSDVVMITYCYGEI